MEMLHFESSYLVQSGVCDYLQTRSSYKSNIKEVSEAGKRSAKSGMSTTRIESKGGAGVALIGNAFRYLHTTRTCDCIPLLIERCITLHTVLLLHSCKLLSAQQRYKAEWRAEESLHRAVMQI